MSKPDWSEQKALDDFHADFLAAAQTIQTQADQMALIERANVDLTEKLKALEARKAAEAMAPIDDDERRTLRDFVVPVKTVESGSIATRGGISSRAPVAASKDVEHAVRMYGMTTADGEFIPGLLDSAPTSEWHAKAQSLAQTLSVVNHMARSSSDFRRTGHARDRFLRHMARGPGVIGKVFSDVTGYGEEVLPEVTLPEVQMAAEQTRGLEGIFASRDIPAGGSHRNPFVALDSVQFFVRSAITVEDPARGRTSSVKMENRTYEAKTIQATIVYDMDAAEDAVIEWMPVFTMVAAGARNAAVEDAIINGDTAATHQDAIATWNAAGRWQDLGAANDHRTAWIGLRARAFDVSNTNDKSGATTAADYLAGDVATLDAPHAFGDLVFVPSNKYYLGTLIKDTNLITFDKRGMGATILTGQIAELGGHPVIRSGFMTDDLASTGLYTGSGSYGGRLVFDRSRFEIRRRAGLRMYLEQSPSKGAGFLTVTDRLVFRTIDGASAKNVHFGFKL